MSNHKRQVLGHPAAPKAAAPLANHPMMLSDADRQQAAYRGLMQLGAQMSSASAPRVGSPGPGLGAAMGGFQQGYDAHGDRLRRQQMAQHQLARQGVMDDRATEDRLLVEAKNTWLGSSPEERKLQAVPPSIAEARILAGLKARHPKGRAAAAIQNFAERQRLVVKHGKDSPEVRRFDSYVRAQKTMNLGGSQIVLDPIDAGTPKASYATTLAPAQKPAHAGAVRKAQEDAAIVAAAPKAEGTATGKAVAASNMALYETVQSGLATVEKADKLIKHLNSSGAITGMGAEIFKGVERLKALMGNDVAAGNVADTEILNAMMGSDVFGMIKSLGIGARGLDTPAEREFMREVLTGTITLNRETIIKLAEIRRDVGQRAIDRWNDKTERGDLDRFYEATGIERVRLGKAASSTSDAVKKYGLTPKPGG